VGMGIEIMGKWKWECSVGMGMGGNGNDSMGVGREWEQESHSRTPLIAGQFGVLLTWHSLFVYRLYMHNRRNGDSG